MFSFRRLRELTMSRQKVALITGCSNPTSLGATMALDLLKRGWNVYATSIEVDSMADLQKSGCEVHSLHLRSDSSLTSKPYRYYLLT